MNIFRHNVVGNRSRMLDMIRRGSKGYDWYYKHLNKEKLLQETQKLNKNDSPLPDVIDKSINRPIAYLQFQINDQDIGKVLIELAQDITPKTVENFVQHCTSTNTNNSNNNNNNNGYKGTSIHRIIKSTAICAGDVENNDGSGGYSSFDDRFFDDENFAIRHRKG